MFTDLHSLCRQVAFPGKCYGRGDTFTQWCSRPVVGIAKHEHRSPPVHDVNRSHSGLMHGLFLHPAQDRDDMRVLYI